MARDSRARRLLRKAEAALVAAIEVYNKPDFRYREETFSILCLNAWELLLKAKILQDNNNLESSLYVYERRTKKDGTPSKRRTIRTNRSNNAMTLTIGQAIAKLEKSDPLPAEVRDNLFGLIEIRDNAVHYVNPSLELQKRVLEIGSAALRNYLELSKQWFEIDLSHLSLYLLPIGFINTTSKTTAVVTDPDEKKLLTFLNTLVAGQGQGADFHVALEVDIKLTRATATSRAPMSVVVDSSDPAAMKVQLSEEDIRQRFPWTYADLRKHLAKRYADFKVNTKFHRIRRPLMTNTGLVHERLLDPKNPKSGKKDFYNANIVREFDPHYQLRKAKSGGTGSTA